MKILKAILKFITFLFNLDDETLVDRMRRGDEGAFELLYNRHWKPVFKFVYNCVGDQYASEHIVEEVFLEVWEKRKTIFTASSFSDFLEEMAKRKIALHASMPSTKPYAEVEFLSREQLETLVNNTIKQN